MIQTDQTLARIVLDHPATARVMQRHRLDFCCRGDRSLADACADRKLDADQVAEELRAAVAERSGGSEVDPSGLSTAALTARIVDRHHGFLRRQLPFLSPLAAKVKRVHEDKDPRLAKVAGIYEELRAALEPHLDQEEEVLFPTLCARQPDREVVEAELRTMHEDHLAVGAMLETLRALTDDYTPPAEACTSWRTLLKELEALETDTLQHVHMENHVLMPRFV